MNYQLTVFPYYEYCGSIGPESLGVQKRCKIFNGKYLYTHIAWSEKGDADITDTVADLKKVLELTIRLPAYLDPRWSYACHCITCQRSSRGI